jgi:hypothetical protein
MAVLTAFHGREAGWLCLATCSLDVAVNAMAILWVTSGISEDLDSQNVPKLPHISDAVSLTSAFRDGYSFAQANIETAPSSVRKRLCPACFAHYSVDLPGYMTSSKQFNQATTLPLELESGNRNERLGLAPPELLPEEIQYISTFPQLEDRSFESLPSSSSEKKSPGVS